MALETTVAHRGGEVVGLATDVSGSGMFVELDEDLPIGAEVRVDFRIAVASCGLARIRANGTVRRHAQPGELSMGKGHGVGIRFEYSSVDLSQIRAFIAQRRRIQGMQR